MDSQIRAHFKKKSTLYREQCPEKCAEFDEKLAKIDPATIVYVNESGLDQSLFRLHARAPRGEKVYAKIPGARAHRLNIIGALMSKKFFAPLTFRGSCNIDVVNYWFKNILLPEIPKGTTIVMDNASFHKDESTLKLIEDDGCHVLFLPPYSPERNKIENYWHVVKSKARPLIQGINRTLEEFDILVGEILMTI